MNHISGFLNKIDPRSMKNDKISDLMAGKIIIGAYDPINNKNGGIILGCYADKITISNFKDKFFEFIKKTNIPEFISSDSKTKCITFDVHKIAIADSIKK